MQPLLISFSSDDRTLSALQWEYEVQLPLVALWKLHPLWDFGGICSLDYGHKLASNIYVKGFVVYLTQALLSTTPFQQIHMKMQIANVLEVKKIKACFESILMNIS